MPNCTLHFKFIMFNLSSIVRRSSTVANYIVADVMSGTSTVAYKNGHIYEYTNVSRRALFNLINNESVSLGFFINNSLLFCDSKCAKYGFCDEVVVFG